MTSGLAPAPREQGWKRIVLLLAAFLLVPMMPTVPVLSAFVSVVPGYPLLLPAVHAALLLVPALAACFVVGWWSGGRALPALFWTVIAALVVATPSPAGAGRYYDLERAWGLLVAGAFGVVCVLAATSPLFTRALSAVGLALLLAAGVVATQNLDVSQPRQLIAGQYASQNAELTSVWQRLLARPEVVEVTTANPTLRENVTQHLKQVVVAAKIAEPFYVALLALQGLLACAVAWGLYHLMSRHRIGPLLAPVREFRFSDQLIWGLVVGITMATLPTLAPLRTLGGNLIVFFGLLYALRGVGVLNWFLTTRGRTVMNVVLGLALFLFGLGVVGGGFALVGLGDTWINWRARATGESRSNSNRTLL